MKRRTLLKALAIAPWLAPVLAKESGSIEVFGNLPAPQKISRVFAAGPPAGVLTYVLAPDKLVGWPQQLDAEMRHFLAPAYRDLTYLGRLAGRGSTVSTETLLKLKPDLIFDIGTVDDTYLSAAQRVAQQTGIPYVLVDGRLPDSPRQLREVGRLLGVGARGEQLALYAEETFALVNRLRRSLAVENRPRVYLGRGIDGLETGLEGSINMEVIEFAGGSNVAAAAGKGGLTRVSMEQILDWNPEIILTQEREFARRVISDPLWHSLVAVRSGRVYCAPNLPFGWLDGPPGVNRLIGVRWLLARLHPEQAPTSVRDDLRVATADFYRLFYGTDLPKDELDRLLEGTA